MMSGNSFFEIAQILGLAALGTVNAPHFEKGGRGGFDKLMMF
jgi:hypothetical protein